MLSEFWGFTLKQFNKVFQILTGINTEVDVVSKFYEFFIIFVENKRESLDDLEDNGKKNFFEEYISDHNRITETKRKDITNVAIENYYNKDMTISGNTLFSIVGKVKEVKIFV